jgi:hypothetical protein
MELREVDRFFPSVSTAVTRLLTETAALAGTNTSGQSPPAIDCPID